MLRRSVCRLWGLSSDAWKNDEIKGSAAKAAAAAAEAARVAAAADVGDGKDFDYKYQLTKRIRAPMDQMALYNMNEQHHELALDIKHSAWCAWLLPQKNINYLVHPRYEVEQLATGWLHPAKQQMHKIETMSSVTFPPPDLNTLPEEEPLCMVIMNCYDSYPKDMAMWATSADPPPHTTVTFRAVVMDRIYWQRTNFNLGVIAKSKHIGKLLSSMTSTKIEYGTSVDISTELNKDETVYNKYNVSIPKYGFSMDLEDTGNNLIDASTPVVPGFLDNESANRVITLPNEINSRGSSSYTGSVFRQPMFIPPTQTHVATLNQKTFQEGTLFEKFFGSNVLGPPIVCCLASKIDNIEMSILESDTEDENQPHDRTSAQLFNEHGMKDRIQKRSMNRYADFREEVRAKAVSDIEGTEVPR